MAEYREHFARCPRCHAELESAGSTRVCRACRGQWVATNVLAEMVGEMHDGMDIGPLLLKPRDGEPVRCPDCQSPMTPLTLEGVPVEACKQHGVWFDTDRLEEALRAAARREPRTVGESIDGLGWYVETEADRGRKNRGG